MSKENITVLKVVIAIAPVFISCLVVAMQWGVVTTRMDGFEINLKEVINGIESKDVKTAAAVDKINDTMVEIQKEMSFIKGEMKNKRGSN